LIRQHAVFRVSAVASALSREAVASTGRVVEEPEAEQVAIELDGPLE
jgi:hypothetical protein